MALIFNGVSSDYYGIHVEKIPDFTVPEKDYEITHVPGKSGDVLIDNGSYKNVEVKYEVSLGDETSSFDQLKTAIISWIHPSSGYGRLEDDDDPDHYRLAVYKDTFDISPVNLHGARASLIFNAKPQRYLKTGDLVTGATGSGNPAAYHNGVSGVIHNPTNFDSYPNMSITGTGTVKVYHADNQSMTGQKLFCELDVYGDEAGINGYIQYESEIKRNAYDSFGAESTPRVVIADTDNDKLIIAGSFPGEASVYNTTSTGSVTFSQTLTWNGNPITKSVTCACLVHNSGGNFLFLGGRMVDFATILVYRYNSTSNKYVEFCYMNTGTALVQKLVELDSTRVLMISSNKYVYVSSLISAGAWSNPTSERYDLGGKPNAVCRITDDHVIVSGTFSAVGSDPECKVKILKYDTADHELITLAADVSITQAASDIAVSSFLDGVSTTYHYVAAFVFTTGSTSTISLYRIPNTLAALNAITATSPAFDGKISYINAGTIFNTEGYDDYRFRLVVSGSFSKKVAYYSVSLGASTVTWTATYEFRDYIPNTNTGLAFESQAYDASYIYYGTSDNEYSYLVIVSNDEIKAVVYAVPPAASVTPNGITIVSELADAYSVQSGHTVNKNYAVYFVDGIVPKMGEYTKFVPTSGITEIQVVPKWWTL